MKNPSILFTAPGISEIVDKDIPEISSGEVLVRLERSTVSAGTERANLMGDANVTPVKGAEVVFPRQSGYSSSGVVVKIADAVTSVKVGDRVSCAWSLHSKYCKLSESKVFFIEENVSFANAALTHIATFPLAAIRKCRLEIGESALVMGLGVLGLVAIKLLKLSGAAPIIAVDPVPCKRQEALALGADYALDPFDENFSKMVKKITGGGAQVCLEITGLGSGLDMALDCMARFGRVALLGCTRSSDFSIDYYRKVHGPGISLIGAHTNARPKQESFAGYWSEADDEKTILRLIALGRIDFEPMIAEVHKYSDAKAVYHRLATEKSFPIVQFDWKE